MNLFSGFEKLKSNPEIELYQGGESVIDLGCFS